MSSTNSSGNQKSNDPRLCIVTRDEKGYGLTVHGKKPVVVQVVRAEGAAWKAGIREHDEILEVNGVSVEDMDHTDVVNRIKQKNVVEFKVVSGTPKRHRNGATAQRKKTQISRQTITTTISERTVTDPASADPEKVYQLCQQSNETSRRALKAAQQNYKELQQKVKAQPENSDLRKRLDLARQQVDLLTKVVEESSQPSLRASVSVSETNSTLASVSSSLVLSPPSSSSSTSSSPASSSLRPWVSVAQAASSTSPRVIPLLEEPSVEATTELPLSHTKSCSMPEQADNSAAVRLAARSKSDTQEKRRPVSMDVSSLRAATVVPSPPSTPVSGSTKSLKSVSQPQGIDAAGEDQSGSNTPEPISEELSGHRRTNSLEVFGPGNSDGSPQIPKKRNAIVIPDHEMEEDEDEYQAAEAEVKLFSNLDKVLESPAACSKLISYAYTTSMTPDGEVNLHRILFIVVMLDFQHCAECLEKSDFMKDLRRITYEIYSTFIAVHSPLNVKLPEPCRNDLMMKMQRDDEESSRPHALKSSLRTAYVQIKNNCDLLTRFQRDLKNGMDSVLTQTRGVLRHLMPREDQVRFMEQTLGRHCDQIHRMPESYRRSALASAFATVYKYYQGSGGDDKMQYKSMENLALGNAAPFNSKLSKSRSSAFPNLTRRGKTTFLGHSLSMKTVEVEANCEVCNSIICGTAPQAEVCHHCGLYFHKECRSNYKRQCDRSKRSSIFSFRQDKTKPKDGFGSMSGDGRERLRKNVSREGSADVPNVPAVSPPNSGSVSRMVEGFEKQNSIVVEDDPPRADSFETSLGRSESLKTPPVSRPSVNAWRNKSFMEHFEVPNPDCSQHGDVISEAESMQPGSSSDSIGQTSITSATSLPQDIEAKENEVRQKLEEDPLLTGLPADVETYIQDFGFRTYYDRLTKEGSRKSNKDLKDYQIACCEMYFQELSHIRSLKVMQFMYVEQWPPGADDLKAAMGLDKLVTLIQLREELIELLKKRLDFEEKKFSNMGAAYEEWLNETRSVQLKVLLGCIRYKGENHFDKLLQERYKRVGWLVERTFNKLNLFDMMISVNQHACRPSLHLSTVKKALGRLQKHDKANKTDLYARELDVWKAAERRLYEVAGYLNDLKQKVVDLIPKVDTTKLHASMPNRQLPACYRDIPRTLNSFYFLRDVDCTVRLQQEGKAKDARLLVFEPFCIFLYVDANNPERFVLRQWERIPAVVQFTIIEHVMKDNTTKRSFIIFLDVREDKGRDEYANRTSKNPDVMSVSVTVKADEASVDSLFRLFTHQAASNKKPSVDRRQGMGSSMSLFHPRNGRSGSTASLQSSLPPQESPRGSLKPTIVSDDTFEEEVPSKAPAQLLAVGEEFRKSMMQKFSISDENYDQMVDVVESNGPHDNIELLLLLSKHMQQYISVVTDLGARIDAEGAKKDDKTSAEITELVTGLESIVKSYTERMGEDQVDRTPVNSVFEEVIIPEDNRIKVFQEPLHTASDKEEEEEVEAKEVLENDEDQETYEEIEQGPASIQDEETTKALSSDESSERSTNSMDELDDDNDMITIAKRLVEKAFTGALQVVSQEMAENEADISVMTSG